MEYNPISIALKRFMVQILESDYQSYDDLLSRIGNQIVTKNDITKFADMINVIYRNGYRKAVNDYKNKLTEMGIEVNITEKNLDDSH